MRKVAERFEMQEAGATLEGVKGAENRINGGCISRIVLKHEDSLLDVLEQFHGFAVKFAQELQVLGEIEVKRQFFTARKRGRGNGVGRRSAATGLSASQVSGQAGMAVPRSQASKTEVIHICHPLKLRMDSSVNLPGPSNIWSNHARATLQAGG